MNNPPASAVRFTERIVRSAGPRFRTCNVRSRFFPLTTLPNDKAAGIASMSGVLASTPVPLNAISKTGFTGSFVLTRSTVSASPFTTGVNMTVMARFVPAGMETGAGSDTANGSAISKACNVRGPLPVLRISTFAFAGRVMIALRKSSDATASATGV